MEFDNHVIQERAKHGLPPSIPDDYHENYHEPIPCFGLHRSELENSDFISDSPESYAPYESDEDTVEIPRSNKTNSGGRKRPRVEEDDSTWGIKRLRIECRKENINTRDPTSNRLISKPLLLDLYKNAKNK